jgi:ABC-2 type transport system permease protein
MAELTYSYPARAGLSGTVRSELTKIGSVRSTYWTLAVLVLVSVAWSIIFCDGTAVHWARMSPQARAGVDPTASSVLGVALLGQLMIVVLGSLTITSEFSTQAIRGSLTVMPRRGVFYAAKAAVLAAVTVLVAFPACLLAFFVGQSLLHGTGISATLTRSNVLSAVLAAATYVVVCGLFSYALGGLLRSTAGAISLAYGLLFLLPELARALPAAWYDDMLRWMPGGQTVGVITSSTGLQGYDGHFFQPWAELAIFAGYTVVLLIAGGVALCRRDA